MIISLMMDIDKMMMDDNNDDGMMDVG